MSQIYLGAECEEFLRKSVFLIEDVENIRENALNFYIKGCSEIKKRFPIDSLLFQQFQFVDPCIALNLNRTQNLNSLQILCNHFSKLINTVDLLNEWHSLPTYFKEEERQKVKDAGIEEFWNMIAGIKDYNDELIFKNIFKLAEIVLSLPHSNAECERIFSIVTDAKTKKRNCLGNKTLNAIAVIRSHLKEDDLNCTAFQITETHLNLMKNQ